MKNPLSLVVIVLALGVLGWLGYSSLRKEAPVETPAGVTAQVPEGATVVTLTKDGFVPSMITIPLGTTVAFVTENGKIFWPASNLHPSHALYPEFDPLSPVQPDEAWSFTFTKAGEWRYHDHLAPYYTGTITVTP